jgi:hypothetical protein
MGVPVVTLEGATYASRAGVSLLTNVGLSELISQSPEEYVESAVQLGADTERLAALRTRLRDMVSRSPLTDARRFTANLEKAYREMWARYVLMSGIDMGYKDAHRIADAGKKRNLQIIIPIPIASCSKYRGNPDALDGSSFVICAMFTPGEKYFRYADRLAASCEKYRLPYCIYEVACVHTSISLRGTENLAYTKANFIAFNMEKFPTKNILYVDADVLFKDYPERLSEISSDKYDFAVYNWLSDKHNEAYMPIVNSEGGEESISEKYYALSRSIELYCPDQLLCSGGVQFYRNSSGVKSFLEYWQHVIAQNPTSADDECLDYAYNNLNSTGITLRAMWLDKPYLRMPWWPHVKPIILHPGMPVGGKRMTLPDIGNRKRYYPERCCKKQDNLIFPRDYIIDVEEKILFRVDNSCIVDKHPIKEVFWIYPEEM